MHDCSREKIVYTLVAVRQQVCIHNCQGKKGVYALKQGQAREKGRKLRLRVNRICQVVIRQEIQRKKRNVIIKSTSTLRRSISPQWSRHFCYKGKTLYGQG
jgi:hypothetical protein